MNARFNRPPTPINVISSQDREDIDDEDGIHIETRSRTIQTGQVQNNEHQQHLRTAFRNERRVEEKGDEEFCSRISSMIRHYCSNKYGAIFGSFILGCILTAVFIFQYILGLVLLGAFGFLATIYLCWFCVMNNGHYCCNNFGACLGIFGALLFVCSLSFAVLWYNRYPFGTYGMKLAPGIIGVVGMIGGLGFVTMYLCWMSMSSPSLPQSSMSSPVTDA